MDNEYTLIDFIKDFENRKGIATEEKLFFYLDYAVSDENFNETTYQRKNDAVDRFNRVNKLLKNTDDSVIESNIYLKKCKDFIDLTKKDCLDLLLDYRSGANNIVSKEVSTEELLPVIDEPELLGLEIVEIYNEVANEIEKMYTEINRLNIWNLINEEKEKNEDIATVSLIHKSGDTGILKATFKDKNKHNSYLGYVYKKRK